MAAKTAISSVKKATTTITEIKKRKVFVSSLHSICRILKKTPIIGIMVAEFIGTLLLTTAFIQTQGSPIYVGFSAIGIILIVGGISGAHLNPAITVGAWVTRRASSVYALGYIAAQVLGATTAWLILKNFLNESSSAVMMGSTKLFQAATLPTEHKEWYIFFAELFGATILTLGIVTAIRLKNDKTTASLAIGFATLTGLYVAMSLTSSFITEQGTTFSFLNPAIAGVSQALVFSAEAWVSTVGIYIIAPIVGAIIGFAIHDFLQSQVDHEEIVCCEVCNK